MYRRISIPVLITLVALPIAMPLLAAMVCCPPNCVEALRQPDECCKASAIQETNAPVTIAPGPVLAAPEAAPMEVSLASGPAESTVPTPARSSPSDCFNTPLRI